MDLLLRSSSALAVFMLLLSAESIHAASRFCGFLERIFEGGLCLWVVWLSTPLILALTPQRGWNILHILARESCVKHDAPPHFPLAPGLWEAQILPRSTKRVDTHSSRSVEELCSPCPGCTPSLSSSPSLPLSVSGAG